MGCKQLRFALYAALIPALLAFTSVDVRASKSGKVIGGFVVGAAVGAALSKKHRHRDRVYVPTYVPYPAGGYGPAWAQTYSPAPGVMCYPAQRACYNVGGAYNPHWTWTTYAR